MGAEGAAPVRNVGKFSEVYGFAATALALASSGTTPSCCIRPRASQLIQPSAILLPLKRAMLTPEMVTCFPVGAIPLRSPLCVPRQDQRAVTVSTSAMMSSIVNRRSGKAVRWSVALFFALFGLRPTSGAEAACGLQL